MGIMDMLSGMDSDTADSLLRSMDEEQIQSALSTGIENYIVPHLQDIREAAAYDYDDREEVREIYESYSEEKQDEVFHDAAADLIAIAAQVREQPTTGMKELKTRLRDPYTMEALLLIFNNEAHVDPEFSEDQKEFVTTMTKWAGINILPEMYQPAEVQEVVEIMHGEEADYTDVLTEQQIQKIERQTQQ